MAPSPSWLRGARKKQLPMGSRTHERNSPTGAGVGATVEERRVAQESSDNTARVSNTRRLAEETLAVATATLSELEAQTEGLSRVAKELDSCEMSVVQVCVCMRASLASIPPRA